MDKHILRDVIAHAVERLFIHRSGPVVTIRMRHNEMTWSRGGAGIIETMYEYDSEFQDMAYLFDTVFKANRIDYIVCDGYIAFVTCVYTEVVGKYILRGEGDSVVIEDLSKYDTIFDMLSGKPSVTKLPIFSRICAKMKGVLL